MVANELLILYVQLLCQIEPMRVRKELMTLDYPLDDCLDICLRYNVYDAAAYLFERSGNIQKALELKLKANIPPHYSL